MQVMSVRNMTVQLLYLTNTIKDLSPKIKPITDATKESHLHTSLRSKKDLFPRNSENKRNFIQLLSDTIQSRGCTTVLAECDADLLIVQTAVARAKI